MSGLVFPLTIAVAVIVGDVPVDLERDEARGLARAELSNPQYDDDPSLLERAIAWVITKISEWFNQAADVSPGGWVGLVILTTLLALAWVVIRHRFGPLARSVSSKAAVFGDAPRSAQEHRTAADTAAAAGDYSTAVVERFRAIARSLEERDLLDVRPGRTVGEVVDEVSERLPACVAELAVSARIFADVRYGEHAATADHDAQLRVTDARITSARPAAGHEPPPRVALPR